MKTGGKSNFAFRIGGKVKNKALNFKGSSTSIFLCSMAITQSFEPLKVWFA